jgi:hypothetical protein
VHVMGCIIVDWINCVLTPDRPGLLQVAWQEDLTVSMTRHTFQPMGRQTRTDPVCVGCMTAARSNGLGEMWSAGMCVNVTSDSLVVAGRVMM